MKHFPAFTHPLSLFRLSLLLAFCALAHPIAAEETVEQKLTRYAGVSRSQRYALAKELCDSFLSMDVYFTPPPPVNPTMPSDTLNALVYYGAVNYFFCNDNDSLQLAYTRLALPLLEHHHPLYYNNVLANKARTYLNIREVKKALETALQAERACRAINDYRELSRVYTTLSFISTSQKQGQDAVDYIQLAIDANRKSGDTLLIHMIFGAACEAYCTQGDYLHSIDYGWQSVRAARNRGSAPVNIASHLDQLGYTYYLADSLEAGKRVLLDALRLKTEAKDSFGIEMTYQYLGLICMKENNKAEAAKWFRKALEYAQLKGYRRDVCNLSRNLSDAIRDSDPKESLRLLELSTLLRDTIYNEELQAKLSEASASFHNDQLQQENENTRRVNRIILLSSTVGTLLFVGIIAMLIYSARTRKQVISTLRKLQMARDTFFTNVTHELRTPLTVITGLSHQLGESIGSSPGNDDKAVRDLGLIERNGNQMLTLVNQLLDIAKASSDLGNVRWQRGNVVAFVSMVVESARPLADTNGDRLTGIDAGADAYLYKPFRSDELLLRMEQLLEQRRMLQRKFSMQMGLVNEADEPATIEVGADSEVSPDKTENETSTSESIFERNVRQANEQFLTRFDAIVLRLLSESDLSTDRVASELCMSRSQLARKLRAVIDMTPAAYILDIRLREVKRLLAVTPPLTLLDIALRCGFSDHAHLTNTFKRKYGITPSQFMKAES